MNLALTKRGDYVVRSALVLARAYPKARKVREVVGEMAVPAAFASQILACLGRAGLASSKAGRDGGYRLARPPEQVSLLEVVEAGEGPLHSQRCALGDGPCHWRAVCPLHETWTVAVGRLRETLAATSLAEVAHQDEALELGTYLAPPGSHRLAEMVVGVEDTIQVEMAAAAAAERLGTGSSWLCPLAEAAHAEGDLLRVRVGPRGPAWLGKTVLVRTGRVEERGEERALPITWEATGPSGLFPRMEAEVVVRALDAERSELHLRGRYHPPLGRAGQLLDEALLHRVAKATVRGFLRRVAHALEADLEPGSLEAPSLPVPSTVLGPTWHTTAAP
ncbi:MAG: Rrf2 family transcriptional regulator [Actinomycetota bacterium]|nr:Rrf2 family transcriptional regulator [Actinomycetota bacterium]